MVTAFVFPNDAVDTAQSVRPSVKFWVVLSVYVMVAVTDVAPLVAAPRKPSLVVVEAVLSLTTWPAVWRLSLARLGTWGQLNGRPLTTSVFPGPSPAAVSACCE